MRALSVLLACAAALVAAAAAGGALQPVERRGGELELPRVRAGTVRLPQRRGAARVQVIVQLAQPPLARYHARSLSATTGARRVQTGSAAARAYLSRLATAQRAAAAELRRTIPGATISRRYRVVLNALAVELPATRLPALVRLPLARRVYPSLRYTLGLNRSPAVIGAGVLGGPAGARGEGMKIAIVDDGVDADNRFFDPGGYRYPPGFPKGAARYTTPKVIVARAFPGAGSGRRGRLPVDPGASFHGTHVAGIAAGNAGTSAPAGDDHPPVAGLAGVAPRAWIGNYRVFTVPTPIGRIANTPEIVAAFEAAVADGMDVLNFSGGGPQTEPATDAVLEAVRNVAAAGVVPVIAAGNDRDEFGLGTVGSPGTAPEAISVAATSSTQVFGSALEVLAADAPEGLRRIPLRPAADRPLAFSVAAREPLVDVGTIVGTDTKPVDRLLCGPPGRPNAGPSTLPPGSLEGAVALASRGVCTFVSKARRAKAAGAIGLVLVDNRPGEANVIPIPLPLPAGMIADLDGARLRAYLAGAGGRTLVRVADGPLRIETGRSGIVTSFSSGGPTPFGHDLKPDVSAPGGQILSSTLPRFGGPFAVFDGTSMAAPHVAGAAALLLERHRGWTPQEVKSALVATAGPAWADTARTAEAPAVLEGGGLVDVRRADDPLLFTDPVSLSLRDLDVTGGAAEATRLVRVRDAGGGAGTWRIELRAQAATAGVTLQLPAPVQLAPGGEAHLVVGAHAAADAQPGENYGFVVLRRGDVARRIPYFFLVTRPGLASVPVRPLRRMQTGDTRRGESKVTAYRYPSAPFGPPPDYVGPPMRQDGAERVYSLRLPEPVVNAGAAVILSSGRSAPDPWLLGSRDENDVQGYAGTPVNVNNFTLDYRAAVGAAGTVFPRPKTYYLAVDSGRDPFSGRSLAGRFVLRAWVNDVEPPRIVPVTTRVAAGRPTLVARILDAGSGVDPLSLVVAYRNVLVGAAAYDPISGLAVFPLPREAPPIAQGRPRVTIVAGDYQETKNVSTPGGAILPNTAFRRVSLRAIRGPTVSWLRPAKGACVRDRARLLVVAGSTARIRSVRFLDGRRRIATVRRGSAGLYAATWNVRRAKRGRHVLRAVVLDARGRRAVAARAVRVCR